MSKELFISASPHETKVAVLEDDLLVEVYHERDTNTGLVGGIYKGRVNRVLPGMQSAFVDIGLERDAFLYVSDFFEDAEEYDKIVAEAEARVTTFSETGQAAAPAPTVAEATAPSVEPPSEIHVAESPIEPVAQPPSSSAAVTVLEQPAPAEVVPPPATSAPTATPPPLAGPRSFDRGSGPPSDFRRGEHRGRRRRRHGQGFGDRKFGPKPEFRERPVERPAAPEPTPSSSFEVLPGESLAKYRNASSVSSAPEIPTLSEDPSAKGLEEFTGPELVHEEVVPIETSKAELESQYTEAGIAAPETMSAQTPVAEEFPAAQIPAPPVPEIEGTPIIEDTSPPAPHVEATPTIESAPKIVETPPTAGPVETHEPRPESKPRPLWNRLVSSVMGKAQESSEDQEPKPFGAASPTEPAHESAPHEVTPVEFGHTAEESGEVPAGTEPTAGTEHAMEEAAPGEATAETAASGPSPEAGAPTGRPAREYTLREPSQRPRFAPRRRGRQGRSNREVTPGGPPAPRREAPRAGNHQPMQIAELLKEGQEILVQIAKEPLGRKGARITSHIALPGRYLVYMPTVDHIGVSRKIASEEERLRLKNIILDNKGPVPGGFIVRTAGAGRPEDELKADMKFLSTLWSDIRTKAERTKAPALLHRDLDLMQRILRDILSPDFKTVRVDSEIEYERALEFVSRCQPSLVGHVKLYTRDTPIFEEFGIQAEIDKALKSKVWLKSGGYIVINQTEALVAIDVNTGKYVGKTNRLEDTIVKTNIDAVKEIVRQIRLRDLGGIIVIDFIDMDERRNRNRVVQALEEALRFDRAPTKILSFNDFGLVALTRKRVKQSLERTLCEPCAYCTGTGWIKSITTVCYEILAEARKMAAEHEGVSVTLRVHPEVARALKSREGVVLSELESITHKDVIVKSDPSVHQERFEIY